MTLEETLTNAIRHGNQKDSTKRVARRVSIERRPILAIRGGRGRGF